MFMLGNGFGFFIVRCRSVFFFSPPSSHFISCVYKRNRSLLLHFISFLFVVISSFDLTHDSDDGEGEVFPFSLACSRFFLHFTWVVLMLIFMLSGCSLTLTTPHSLSNESKMKTWGDGEKEYKTHKKYIISVLISICLCRSSFGCVWSWMWFLLLTLNDDDDDLNDSLSFLFERG